MRRIFHWPIGPLSLALLTLPGIQLSAHAQEDSFRRLADLNPGPVGSFPTNLTVFAGQLYFSAYTLEFGRELWKFDGNSIVLTTNINDTADDIGFGVLEGNDSVPEWLTGFNGALHFSAFDPRRGGELWRYDGTNGVRLAVINPDPNDTIKFNPNNSWPRDLTVLGNTLVFAADTGMQVPNYELWQYDGAAASMITNIHPDIDSDHSSYPTGMTTFNGAIYFMADDGVNGFELWKHSAAGTVLLTNINPGDATSSSFPKLFTPFNGELFFQAFDSANGYELWKTDGSIVTLVTNLNAESSSFPEFLTVFNNALYFRASGGAEGVELWKYDGDIATLVFDIHPAGDAFPKNLTVWNDVLYFAADDGVHGWELWRHDGVSTTLAGDLNPAGDSFPEELTVLNGALYFVATTPDTGYELWRYDGETITLAADVNAGADSSFPRYLTVLNNELCFSAAEDGVSNWELWALTSGNLPPIVTITAPTNGAMFTAPASFVIEATASDNDGSIVRVEFLEGTNRLGETTSPPYTFTWTNVTAGDYSLTVRATDNLGAVAESALVTISVTNSTPTQVVLRNLIWRDSEFTFSFTSEAGKIYEAQATEVLGSGEWDVVGTLTGTGSTLTVTNRDLTAPQRFYRVETK